MKISLFCLAVIAAALLLSACTSPARQDVPATDTTITQPEIVSFSVTPSKVESGSKVTLNWEVNNAETVFIDRGIGFVSAKGSLEVTPRELTSYNLTAGKSGVSVTSAVIVNVIPFVRVASPVNVQEELPNGVTSYTLPRLNANESYAFYNGAVMVGADDHFIVLRNNPNAHNPTWAELKAFLEADVTDRRAYIPGKYTCGDFAETLHNNAEAAGIRAAIVAIELQSPTMAGAIINHSLNAFETTDRGIIFIDDTSSSSGYYADKIANMRVGEEYICVSISTQKGQLSTWPSMGKVLAVDIFQW